MTHERGKPIFVSIFSRLIFSLPVYASWLPARAELLRALPAAAVPPGLPADPAAAPVFGADYAARDDAASPARASAVDSARAFAAEPGAEQALGPEEV